MSLSRRQLEGSKGEGAGYVMPGRPEGDRFSSTGVRAVSRVR